MATLTLSSNHSQFAGYVSYSISVNRDARTSTINASVYIKKNQSIATTGTWDGWLSLTGNDDSYVSWYGSLKDSYVCIGSKSTTITHNSDGSGSCRIAATIDGPSGTSMASAQLTGSVTVTLENLATKSTVKATSANIGSTSTITITRGNNTLTHTLTYSFKGESSTALTGTIATKTSDISVNWTIPDSFYTKIPNSKSGTVTITCTTYSGSTSLGSNTCTLTASANSANCKPTFNPTFVDTNNTTIALTGNSAKMVRYYSNVKVTSNATGNKSATIKSQTIKNGATSSSTSPTTFNAVDSNDFIFTAEDSRGISNSISKSMAMVDYVKLTCYIGNETPTADGKYTFTVRGNYFNDTFGSVKNTLTVYYRWKTNSGSYSAWKAMTLSLSNNNYTATTQLTGLDYKTTYTFQAYAVDKLATVYTVEKAIKSKPVFDWSGEDFAFNVPVTILDAPVMTSTVLFDGNANGTVTLSDTVSNYDCIEIYFTDNNGRGCGFTKVYDADGKQAHLSLIETVGSGSFYIRHTNYNISGSTIAPASGKYGYSYWSGSSWTNSDASNYLKIVKVVGLR